jgi:hypothetical protein
VERFKIPLVFEFFGATEGTTMLFNIAGRPGAIGRVSPFMVRSCCMKSFDELLFVELFVELVVELVVELFWHSSAACLSPLPSDRLY